MHTTNKPKEQTIKREKIGTVSLHKYSNVEVADFFAWGAFGFALMAAILIVINMICPHASRRTAEGIVNTAVQSETLESMRSLLTDMSNRVDRLEQKVFSNGGGRQDR